MIDGELVNCNWCAIERTVAALTGKAYTRTMGEGLSRAPKAVNQIQRLFHRFVNKINIFPRLVVSIGIYFDIGQLIE